MNKEFLEIYKNIHKALDKIKLINKKSEYLQRDNNYYENLINKLKYYSKTNNIEKIKVILKEI